MSDGNAFLLPAVFQPGSRTQAPGTGARPEGGWEPEAEPWADWLSSVLHAHSCLRREKHGLGFPRLFLEGSTHHGTGLHEKESESVSHRLDQLCVSSVLSPATILGESREMDRSQGLVCVEGMGWGDNPWMAP